MFPSKGQARCPRCGGLICSVVGGVAAGLGFALHDPNDNWTDQIRNNHETEVSGLLRDKADDIQKMCSTARKQFDDMRMVQEEMDRRQREEEVMARRQQEEEEKARRRIEEEEKEKARKQREEEVMARRQQEEEVMARRRIEEEKEKARRQREEEVMARRQQEEEEKARRRIEEEEKEKARRQREEEVMARRQQEEEVMARRRIEEEKEKARRRREEEENRRQRDQSEQTGDDQGDEETDDEDKERDQEEEESDREEETEEEESDSEEETEEEESDSEEEKEEGTIRFALLNTRSMNNRTSRIVDLITQNNLDVFLTTETWLQYNTAETVLSSASPEDFRFHSQQREGRGGGVAIQFSEELQGEQLHFDHLNIASFEFVVTVVQHAEWDQPVVIINLYHPPGYNQERFRKFLNEFQSLLDEVKKKYSSIIVTGDFNIHVNNERRSYTDEFEYLLLVNDLEQRVEESTHRRGNTLDLVITTNVEVSGLFVRDDGISDHYTVYFNAKPKDTRKKTKRNKNDEQTKRFRKTED
ncbi:uncharacterized protein [Pagrus major]|uniref:uncharacterized protein isoform X2 n=1 Tax=Pagrus major TaxID=143350 RepID=UPI003CC8644C